LKSERKKKQEKQKEVIIMSLPAFINQLLLLMNSGVILTEAFCRIAQTYSQLPDEKKNYFTEEITGIYEQSLRNGENVITGFYRFSRLSNVRELARTAGILMEYRQRGSELWLKLAEHSDSLWQERKRNVMEKIRLAESRMSFPLGLMLLSLIIITAAPAMMQI